MKRTLTAVLLVCSFAFTQMPCISAPADNRAQTSPRPRTGPQIEPGAGNWQTWVIPSGKAYRVPPPPGPAETRAELATMGRLIDRNDDQIHQQIRYWDAGSPQYRWIDIISDRMMALKPMTSYPHRVYAYVAMAMYDATIATWESKYHYKRPRPSELDPNLPTALAVPNSPSYPSEHAAVAQAAATVLAYLLPEDGQSFQRLAEQSGWSRVRAGLQYPSDTEAGFELGRRIGEQVIAKAKADGSDKAWTGTVPTGRDKWVGSDPRNVTAADPGWLPLLMTSRSQFRPPPPPPSDSPQVQAEKEAVRTFPRTFETNAKAFYWASPEGDNVWPYRYAGTWMFEDRLDRNPPRAARVYALIAAVMFDAFIASQDGKFAYWYLRPHMLDPSLKPLFGVPVFPTYPSNHSTFSAARAEVLAYLFPAHADFVRNLAEECGQSRIWAGIHFEMDHLAGAQLGRSVAQLFISRAKSDGSQGTPHEPSSRP